MPGRTAWMFRLRRCFVKFHGSGEIGFCDDGNVRAVEYRRILEGLVFAFGYREQHEAQVFAEIVGRRADQVADVFDEQEIQTRASPSLERILDHGRFQMANRAGDDLLHRSLAASEASRVIFRGEVADQGRDPVAGMKKRESFLEKSRLARTGTGNETDGQHAGFAETLAQRASEDVVLFQDVFSNFDEAWFLESLSQLQSGHHQFATFQDFGSWRAALRTAERLNRLDVSGVPDTAGQFTMIGTSSMSSFEPSRGVCWQAIS